MVVDPNDLVAKFGSGHEFVDREVDDVDLVVPRKIIDAFRGSVRDWHWASVVPAIRMNVGLGVQIPEVILANFVRQFPVEVGVVIDDCYVFHGISKLLM